MEKENEKKTRLRAPNFTSSESHHLCEVLEKYKLIIENKKTDGASLQDKQNAWKLVVRDYNSTTTSYTRTLESLQQCYKNMKKKVKKELSSRKMSIPVNRDLLVESMEEHGTDDWSKISEYVGVPQDTCQEEYETMKKEAKRLTTDIKKDILATGGGPSTQPIEDPLLNKVCSFVGPTLEGLYTVYDGDSPLMEHQGITPVEAMNNITKLEGTNKEETGCLFNNDRANLKRKPHQKLTSTPSKTTKKKMGNESVSDKFKTLAEQKMEIVLYQKKVLEKQLQTEDQKHSNALLENQILKLRLQEEEEKLAHARLLRSTKLEQIYSK